MIHASASYVHMVLFVIAAREKLEKLIKRHVDVDALENGARECGKRSCVESQ